jgi:hypothetical protein
MADDTDRASEYEEKMRAHAIAQRKPVLKCCGACYNCGAILPKFGMLYCDSDCAEDDEKRRKLCGPG